MSLGGGIAPIGACVATDEVWNAGYGSRKHGLLHTSTFGGNTRACAAGLKAIEVLLGDDLVARARETGAPVRAVRGQAPEPGVPLGGDCGATAGRPPRADGLHTQRSERAPER